MTTPGRSPANGGDAPLTIVTGGLGFIGSNLVDALIERGHRITVIDRTASIAASDDPRIEQVAGPLTDIDATRAALEGADTIFHVAANPNVTISINEPLTDFALNTQSTAILLEAARQAGVRRFVFVSSALIYGSNPALPLEETALPRPLVPYAAGKVAGEAYARAYHECYGLETVIARVFCVYGPGRNAHTSMVEVPRYLRWHLQEQPIQVVGDAQRKTRDFIHVEDVVAALILLAERGNAGEVYNVGSGKETSMAELIDLIGRVTDRPPTVDAHPEVLDDSFGQVAAVDRLTALGFRPRWSLADGMRALAEELGDDPEAPMGNVVLSACARPSREVDSP